MGFLYRKFLGGEETEMESIVRNLRYVLGSRRGAASVVPDFGLSDLLPQTPEDLYNWINQEVRQVVTRYEPRVEIVAIEEDYDDEGHPNLRLHLKLRDTQEDLQLMMNPRRREVTIAKDDPEDED